MTKENSQKILKKLKRADRILSGEVRFRDKESKREEVKEIRESLDNTKFYEGKYRVINFDGEKITPSANNSFYTTLLLIELVFLGGFTVFLIGEKYGLGVEKNVGLSLLFNLVALSIILFAKWTTSSRGFKTTLEYYPVRNVDKFVLENLGRNIDKELKELEESL
jgi:hypothetical protein